MGAMANNSTTAYVGWEEVVVSSGRGRREVHYFLKRNGGGRDLVVVGKEKSAKDMTYDYSIKESKILLPILSRFSGLKLKARRDVVDWLDSVLAGEKLSGSPRLFRSETGSKLKTDIILDVQMRMLENHLPGFAWLGSSWTCLKRRKHYKAFCRNGAVVSAQDFAYVLAEENKRLVAYLEDLYEDTSGKKMVVVRWFHKIDEVDLVLTRNFNDKEIFFSRCLQDISIECIDGIATVLSPEHYETLSTEATRMGLMPFVCYRQFDNGAVKPFEVTGIQGYWKQELLRKRASLLEVSDNMKPRGSTGDAVGPRPNKRIRTSKDCDPDLKFSNGRGNVGTSVQFSCDSLLDPKGGMIMQGAKEGCSYPSLGVEDNARTTNCGQQLTVGSHIEVLSQDSGIRGCWFRALVIKKHKNKVKVQYKDIKDAVDDSKNLEEWVLPSRLAAQDVLGIRLCGRSIIRPTLLFEKGRVREMLNVGSIVDAWWHDGWWEGIVVNKESPEKLSVYFPGENQDFIFSPRELRLSKEWFENDWHDMKERPDIASKVSLINKVFDTNQDDVENFVLVAPVHDDVTEKVIKIGVSLSASDNKMPMEHEVVRDLSKDNLLRQLRWISSGKKRHARGPVHKDFRVALLNLPPFNLWMEAHNQLAPFVYTSLSGSTQAIDSSPYSSEYYSDDSSFRGDIHRWKKDELLPRNGTKCGHRSETTLAAFESLAVPLVQEVVFLADIRCTRCQQRVAETMSKMNGETQSLVFSVLEKTVTLTSTNQNANTNLGRQVDPVCRSSWSKGSLISRLFRFSCFLTSNNKQIWSGSNCSH